MSPPLRWLIEYFEENGHCAGRSVEDLLNDNFVTSELLDSLGIVQMLVGIEDDFGIWLDPAEMQDPRFCTISGLAELIDEATASP